MWRCRRSARWPSPSMMLSASGVTPSIQSSTSRCRTGFSCLTPRPAGTFWSRRDEGGWRWPVGVRLFATGALGLRCCEAADLLASGRGSSASAGASAPSPRRGLADATAILETFYGTGLRRGEARLDVSDPDIGQGTARAGMKAGFTRTALQLVPAARRPRCARTRATSVPSCATL